MSAWHDPVAWELPAPTVIRSTWDYIHRLRSFAEWVVKVSSVAPLWNPAKIIFDNLHKRYLLDLASRGVPVTPTTVLDRGSEVNLATLCGARGWNDIVIKPAVGAGSFETHHVRGSSAEAADILRRLLEERDVLVQPFLRAVEGHGERALVWIDGEFTHAVRKSPRFAGNDEQVSEAVPISALERRVGEAALAPIARELLYARVDVAPGDDGNPVVMELELVEPSLFLKQHPPALQRLVQGIVRRLT
jgi:glutathione synthase/RimK-type ligase-like ATP-grasp enzyme